MPVSLIIQPQKQEIRNAVAFLENYIAQESLSRDLFCIFAVALDEILTNAVTYAFRDGNPHRIKISLDAKDKFLRVVLEDDGAEFNPLLYPCPSLNLTPAERAAGGLGIHIVKNIMDSVTYQRDGNKNILTLEKADEA